MDKDGNLKTAPGLSPGIVKSARRFRARENSGLFLRLFRVRGARAQKLYRKPPLSEYLVLLSTMGLS